MTSRYGMDLCWWGIKNKGDLYMYPITAIKPNIQFDNVTLTESYRRHDQWTSSKLTKVQSIEIPFFPVGSIDAIVNNFLQKIIYY